MLFSKIFIFLLFQLVFSVDKNKFNTCSKADFCNRNRFTDPPTFNIDSNSINVSPSLFEAEISNAKSDNLLQLQVSSPSDGIIRLNIQEKDSKRRQMEDFLKISTTEEFKVDKSDKSSTLKFSKDFEATITHKNFQFDFFNNGENVMSANQRRKFNYEKKQELPEEPVQELANQDEQKTEDNSEENTENQDEKKDEKKNEEEKPNTKDLPVSAVAMDISFINSKNLYGIPEHATDLSLRNTIGEDITSDPYRLYNLDVFEYELDVPMALYGSVPYLISHSKHTTVGVVWLNPSETFIDIEQSDSAKHSHWISETGIVDVLFLMGPTAKDVFSQYAKLTGTINIPPMFSIAYHQCRWNYKDEEDVAAVDAGFDTHNIPYDVIWLDIEHTDKKKYFTWDKEKFPTPEKMQERIASKGRKMVTIVDPHILRDTGYYIYTEAQAKDLYIKNADGKEYDGHCWPGSSAYLDFTDEGVRDWWAEQFQYSKYQGSSSILFTWNDMNEPSVFSGPEVSMHKDAIHKNGLEHREVHNLYGYFMHMATYQGLLRRNPGETERPFVLSRSFFIGSQQWGAIWTGDNKGDWDHLEAANPMLLSLGLTGITFSGADVGGFFGNPEPELLTRWYQAGAFYPFFRGHAHLDTKRREPWLNGEPHTTIIRNAIRTRYSYLPFWYTKFYESSISGIPIIRPLWVEFPQDETTFGMQDQFLVGSELLVKPVTKVNQEATKVYFPDGVWYDIESFKIHQGPKETTLVTKLEKIPVFQRGGSIIPKKERTRRSSTQMESDPFTLIVALNETKSAFGNLYLDDGHSFDYQSGAFQLINFSYKNSVLESSVSGNYNVQNTIERIVIFGSEKPSLVSSNSQSIEFEFDQEKEVLTLRKPGLLISNNWSIQFTF